MASRTRWSINHRGLLSDAQIAGDFVARNAVLAVRQQPDHGKPLIKADGRILEDGPDLGAELALPMFRAALPAALIGQERNFFTSAGRALYAVRPANLDHRIQADIGIGKVANRIDQRGWCSCFHVPNIAQTAGLVKYVNALIWFSNELRVLVVWLPRWIDRHLIPDLSVEHSASLLLVLPAPLLEEEWYVGFPALIAQIGHPRGI